MPREKDRLRLRPRPTATPSKFWPAILGLAVVGAGFTAMMVRLEVIQEGYRLSALRTERHELEERNRRLQFDIAELSTHKRLRALAEREGLGPPVAGQVMMMP